MDRNKSQLTEVNFYRVPTWACSEIEIHTQGSVVRDNHSRISTSNKGGIYPFHNNKCLDNSVILNHVGNIFSHA